MSQTIWNLVIYILVIVSLFALLYSNYLKQRQSRARQLFGEEPLDIDSFFYSPDVLDLSKRRKIWIHLPYERNARKWTDFGSRSSYELNMPYMTLCIKSIIDNCAEAYDIVLFDDTNIGEILHDDNIDLSKLSGTLLRDTREQHILKILHKYGGVLLPASLYLRGSFSNVDMPDEWFGTEMLNTENVSPSEYMCNLKLMGTPPKCETLGKFIEGDLSAMPYQLDGQVIGTKDAKGKAITLDRLMSSEPLTLSKNNFGLYIPSSELCHRKKYQWYCMLSEENVLEANTALSYYMVANIR
jgi:hypothetical protein